MSCGVGHRCGSDLALLWLWHRPVAMVPTGSLAWGPPYAVGAALKDKKQKQKQKQKQNPSDLIIFHFFFKTLIPIPLPFYLQHQTT